ncbi:MAG: hypothetical protein MPJ50_00665 [Pirellulales bacterium]|nr:hypothetical protein [Pirellulales bacterium]
MHQIKIFKGIEGALSDLESEVNSWLKSLEGTVVNISGNIAPQSNAAGSATGLGTGFAPSDVIVVVHYTTT